MRLALPASNYSKRRFFFYRFNATALFFHKHSLWFCNKKKKKKKQEVPAGELPVVHIAIVCSLNRKFYKQRNSQRPICDMQFTVVINELNRELRWQGASYSGAHPVFVAIFTIT